MCPVLLDLFCGAGGAATGYARAGFTVVGVDILPQPLYPFTFIQADALTFELAGYDAYHASPPCQFATQLNAWHRGHGKISHPNLLTPTLQRFKQLRAPWVIENVIGSRSYMSATILLRGDMFGLKTHRPRLFQSNLLLIGPQKTRTRGDSIGVYGKSPDGRTAGGITRVANSLQEARELMDMPWADWKGCKEAIPPAYTEYIGKQLMEAICAAAQPTNAEAPAASTATKKEVTHSTSQ